MKKAVILFVSILVIVSLAAFAEGTWICSNCGENATGNFCANCGQAKSINNTSGEGTQLYLDINFEANWIFDLYDVDMYVDDSYITTIPHGERYTELLNVESGEHTIRFIKKQDKGVQGSESIEINDDSTYYCTINAYSSYIAVSNSSIQSGIDGASLAMIDVKGLILTDAILQLSESGFVNIDSYVENDSVWDENNWIVIDQNVEPEAP